MKRLTESGELWLEVFIRLIPVISATLVSVVTLRTNVWLLERGAVGGNWFFIGLKSHCPEMIDVMVFVIVTGILTVGLLLLIWLAVWAAKVFTGFFPKIGRQSK